MGQGPTSEVRDRWQHGVVDSQRDTLRVGEATHHPSNEPPHGFLAGAAARDAWRTEVLTQMELLDLMFSDPGLVKLANRSPDHPAVTRLRSLELLLTYGGLPSTRAVEAVDALAALAMDRFAWAHAWDPDDFWSLIEEPNQKRLVQSRITDAQQFEHVMAELYIWGWLRGLGVEADLAEREGEPDIGIRHENEASWAEVKVVSHGSQPSRARQDIRKANRQIKKVGGPELGAGVLFLRVSRSPELRTLDDGLPSDAATLAAEVAYALGVAYRSVAHVVLYWDETTAVGDPDRGTVFFTRRRSHVVDHPQPRRRPFARDKLASLGSTVVLAFGVPQSS